MSGSAPAKSPQLVSSFSGISSMIGFLRDFSVTDQFNFILLCISELQNDHNIHKSHSPGHSGFFTFFQTLKHLPDHFYCPCRGIMKQHTKWSMKRISVFDIFPLEFFHWMTYIFNFFLLKDLGACTSSNKLI